MVAYRFEGATPDGVHKMEITYAKGGERVRIDYFRWFEAKYSFLTVIFDRPANRLISVHPESKSYFDRELGDTANPGVLLSSAMQFTPQGTAVIAYASCNEWKIVIPDKSNGEGTTCVTDDGVLLLLASMKPTPTTLTATAIHYGTPPDSVFAPPPGFKPESAPKP
jgi:hypothetical protein